MFVPDLLVLVHSQAYGLTCVCLCACVLACVKMVGGAAGVGCSGAAAV